MKDIEVLLIGNINKQLELYLTEIGEFAPFGCAIDANNKIVPLSSFVDSDFKNSNELLSLLEINIMKRLNSANYLIAAIALNVVVTKNNERFDAVELRIYKKDNNTVSKRINYKIEKNKVSFFNF